MPQRANPQDVLTICPTEMQDIGVPLRLASRMVDTIHGQTNTEDTKLLETLLAAHYVAMVDPRARESTFQDMRQKFDMGDACKGLGSTEYGRQAIAFDQTGTLGRMGLASPTLWALG